MYKYESNTSIWKARHLLSALFARRDYLWLKMDHLDKAANKKRAKKLQRKLNRKVKRIISRIDFTYKLSW